MTKQRHAILDVLHKHPGHYTAEEIFGMTKEILPAISRATVYNNLASLVEERALFKIVGGGPSAIYDTTSLPHAHTVCAECGHIEDVFLHTLDEEIRENLGDTLVDYDLTIRVVCPTCRS